MIKMLKTYVQNDMNIIVKKSIANNKILSSEIEVNVGFYIRLQSYTVTNTELYNYDISANRYLLIM